MKKITVLIPAYNESASLPRLAAALSPLIDNKMTDTPYEWEILIVNDGSRDNTLAIIKELHEADPRYQYLNLSRNFGKENAMLAGLDYASGNAVVIMDADMQHPVDVIPLMIEQWEQGYDDVYGRRSSRGKESIARRQLTKLFYRILQKSTRIDILPNVGDFRLLDRKCINALRQLRETQRYSKGLFSWIGFSKKEIMFEQGSRTEGKSSFNFLSLLNLAIEGITCFTTAPLRFASVMGILTALCAIVYLIYVFVRTLLYGDPVAGYPTIMCVMLFLGGCQLIALGIIGEYISRIFYEAKRRPVYIVESFSGDDGGHEE
ncbi:MAG: glycosyltransferase family 2 protein [Muribaculaceae bacterium]|nr:glycosyltransferase family 2 protein [Muribaculaceae bacterium]